MSMKKFQHIRVIHTLCLWKSCNTSGHRFSRLLENLRQIRCTKGMEERNTGLVIARLIDSYTSPYWRSGISSTNVRNSVFSRVERSGTSGKTLNFSHEYECKYLFLPFQIKNKAWRFHSFIRMSMSCLLHKILQR